jgi:hypothetical protein
MIINIKEKFQDDFTSRIAGEKLRKTITDSSEEIVIDFKDLKIASASFFDEGIAKLALEGWDHNKLNSRLKVKNIFTRDLQLLISVCNTRGLEINLNSEVFKF